jgi:hypothetical protein
MSSTEITKYLKKVLKMVERWCKVMNQTQNDLMSALTIDNLFKSILLKLDKIYTVKDGQIDSNHMDQRSRLKEMKVAC